MGEEKHRAGSSVSPMTHLSSSKCERWPVENRPLGELLVARLAYSLLKTSSAFRIDMQLAGLPQSRSIGC